MHCDWYRTGNFYQPYPPHSNVIHRVVFQNAAPFIAIKVIDVLFYNDYKIKIFIHATAFYYQNVRDTVKEHFDCFFDPEMFEDTSTITFKKSDNFQKLILVFRKMFEALNQKYKRKEFSEVLIQELSYILTWVSSGAITNAAMPTHIMEEYILPTESHINPFRKKSTAILDLFEYHLPVKKNLLKIREKMAHLLSAGENPNQTNERGESASGNIICYLPPEDFARWIWYGGDPRVRPKGGATYYTDSAIDLTKKWNKPEHFNIIVYAFPKRTLLTVQIKSIEVIEYEDQIITYVAFNNQHQVFTCYIPTETFHSPPFEKIKSYVFKLFKKYFSDPTGDAKKTQTNFDNEFSPQKNKNIDIIFDGTEKRIVGFVLVRIDEHKNNIVVKFEYMAVEKDSFLRKCGGTAFFALRWACLVKSMYRAHVVKSYYLASDYNSFCPLQDELATPKYLSKWMLEGNQHMVNLEFGRNVTIHYGRFVAVEGLLSVTDKKDLNRKLSFDEFCYNQFLLSYDNPADKKTLMEAMGREPVQATVVSSVIGPGFFRRREQQFKNSLNTNFSAHVEQLSAVMIRKVPVFMPLMALKLKKNPKEAAETDALVLEDENSLFFQDSARAAL